MGSSAVFSSSGFSGFLDADVWESVLLAGLRGVLRHVFESESTAGSSTVFLDAVLLDADTDFLECVFGGGYLQRCFGGFRRRRKTHATEFIPYSFLPL